MSSKKLNPEGKVKSDRNLLLPRVSHSHQPKKQLKSLELRERNFELRTYNYKLPNYDPTKDKNLKSFFDRESVKKCYIPNLVQGPTSKRSSTQSLRGRINTENPFVPAKKDRMEMSKVHTVSKEGLLKFMQQIKQRIKTSHA